MVFHIPRVSTLCRSGEKIQVAGFAAIDSKWHDCSITLFLFFNCTAAHTWVKGPIAVPKWAKLMNYRHSTLLHSSDITKDLGNSEQIYALSPFSILVQCHLAGRGSSDGTKAGDVLQPVLGHCGRKGKVARAAQLGSGGEWLLIWDSPLSKVLKTQHRKKNERVKDT